MSAPLCDMAEGLVMLQLVKAPAFHSPQRQGWLTSDVQVELGCDPANLDSPRSPQRTWCRCL